jgi:glycosyltransferase involved in cell wall biosynthesis
MEQVAWKLATTWAKLGHFVDVFTTEMESASTLDGLDQQNLKITHLPGRASKYTCTWFKATKQIPVKNFDIVFSVSTAGRNIADICKSYNVPLVMQAHGTSKDEIITKLMLRTARGLATLPKNILALLYDFYLYPKFTCVVAISWGVEKSIAEFPKFTRPRKLIVIPNGVETSLSLSREAGCGLFRIAYVGRLHREKGVDLLLRAIVGLNVELVVAGTGPAEKYLKQLASRLHLDGNVRFLGRLQPTSVAAVLQKSDLVVMPSRAREGLPLVALEALAAGTPVIVSPGVARGFPPDNFPHGITVSKLRVGNLRQNILLRMYERNSSSQISLPKYFELDYVADEYISLFCNLIASSGIVPVGGRDGGKA